MAGREVNVVRKPSSVPPAGRPAGGGDHSSRVAVTGHLEQPTRELGRVTLCDVAIARPPTRPCSRWGLPCRFRCRKRGGLLPRRFTLASRKHFQPAARIDASVGRCAPVLKATQGCSGPVLASALASIRSLRLEFSGLAVFLCCTFLRVPATGRYPASHSVELGLSSRRRFRRPAIA